MSIARIMSWCAIFALVTIAGSHARAEVVWYSLDNVILDDNTQMHGTFSWTYEVDDFENGVGLFTYLDIPWTTHDHTDLEAGFDVGSSIEITLPGSVHDDGVDIMLVLSQPLTPTTSSPLDLAESAYEIGGNGFHTGLFLSGSVSPFHITLSIAKDSPDLITISWEPDIAGHVLQQTESLTPPNWVDAPNGGSPPVEAPVAGPTMFYRVVTP